MLCILFMLRSSTNWDMWFSYCQLFVLPVILLLMLLIHAFITQWCFQWRVCFLRTRITCICLLDFSDILWGPLNANRKQPLVAYVMHRRRSWSSLSGFGQTTFLLKNCACASRAPIMTRPLQSPSYAPVMVLLIISTGLTVAIILAYIYIPLTLLSA